MIDLLQRLLKKRGVESIDKLSDEEKETFSEWQRVLSRKELTMMDLKEFILQRIFDIEHRWRDPNTSNEKKAELIPYHTVYKTLLQAIDAPEIERMALEQTLLAQLK